MDTRTLSLILDSEGDVHMEDAQHSTRTQHGGIQSQECSAPGHCVECGNQHSVVKCQQCCDEYCELCYFMQHRRGSRALHTPIPLASTRPHRGDAIHSRPDSATGSSMSLSGSYKTINAKSLVPYEDSESESDRDHEQEHEKEKEKEKEKDQKMTIEPPMPSVTPSRELGGYNGVIFLCEENKSSDPDAFANVDNGRYPSPPPSPKKKQSMSYGMSYGSFWNYSSMWKSEEEEEEERKKHLEENEKETKRLQKEREEEEKLNIPVQENVAILEQAKYIPVRLTLKERKLLRLLESTLAVCNYVDYVDNPVFASTSATETALPPNLASRRLQTQLRLICSILTGLVVSNDYAAGQELIKDKDFAKYEAFFQTVFEIGRRYKVLNPDKMRTQYAKLLYLLQDCMNPEIKKLLGFTAVKPIVTVYSFLQERGALNVLSDKYIETATHEIIPKKTTSREAIQREIKKKERAVKLISKKYSREGVSEDELVNCLYSIGEYHCFLRFNRDPVSNVMALLQQRYPADAPTGKHDSLSITEGEEGARLTHSHERQYAFCLQSLRLWRDIQHNMFLLWILAERDLLMSEHLYVLRHTGQGVHRVQHCPCTYRAMQSILQSAQRSVGDSWVGSAVIHLGDHNVPNALLFIDKYTQVPRILGPLGITLKVSEDLTENNEVIKRYVKETFTSFEDLKQLILSDFFRHAFDGSGADNFYDAGSCIDGRMTSAWNWCNSVDKKPFKTIFLLSGFVGFDGDWK
eukprot:TRINITY_DN666_c0_g1_i3.p1 TRINITY_DN666_c0_g1~~TRINITY_DN666_c0_g1_i3.p1  ORF type:complete len:748 (-),score=191.42 TRINITY_DN666_c0_g1_i3:75-2318(-)